MMTTIEKKELLTWTCSVCGTTLSSVCRGWLQAKTEKHKLKHDEFRFPNPIVYNTDNIMAREISCCCKNRIIVNEKLAKIGDYGLLIECMKCGRIYRANNTDIFYLRSKSVEEKVLEA